MTKRAFEPVFILIRIFSKCLRFPLDGTNIVGSKVDSASRHNKYQQAFDRTKIQSSRVLTETFRQPMTRSHCSSLGALFTVMGRVGSPRLNQTSFVLIAVQWKQRAASMSGGISLSIAKPFLTGHTMYKYF